MRREWRVSAVCVCACVSGVWVWRAVSASRCGGRLSLMNPPGLRVFHWRLLISPDTARSAAEHGLATNRHASVSIRRRCPFSGARTHTHIHTKTPFNTGSEPGSVFPQRTSSRRAPDPDQEEMVLLSLTLPDLWALNTVPSRMCRICRTWAAESDQLRRNTPLHHSGPLHFCWWHHLGSLPPPARFVTAPPKRCVHTTWGVAEWIPLELKSSSTKQTAPSRQMASCCRAEAQGRLGQIAWAASCGVTSSTEKVDAHVCAHVEAFDSACVCVCVCLRIQRRFQWLGWSKCTLVHN